MTEGSRYYRIEKPVAPAYAQRLAQFYDTALPFALWQQGNKAVATFQSGQAVLPVFLQRNTHDRWLLDEPKGQAYFLLPDKVGRLCGSTPISPMQQHLLRPPGNQ